MSEQTTEQAPIYIIGDTPLAYFLTAKFSLAGQPTLLLGERNPLKNVDTFIFKDETRAQKDTIRTLKTAVMHDTPRMVILCMDSNKIKSGLIYVSGSKLKDVPIISFCHTNSPQLLEEILKQPIIPAYFDGWLTLQPDGKLIFSGASQGFRISCQNKHPHFETVQNTFSQLEIDLEFNKNDAQNFWDYFIPYATCSFFSLKNDGNLREIAKKAAYRQDINTILDEIISVIPESIKIAKENIFKSIYLTPQNYAYPVADKTKSDTVSEFVFICETIQNRKKFKPSRLPTISEIIKKQSLRIFSSVEKREFALNKSK